MAVFVLLFFFLVFIVLAVFLYEKGIKSSENQPGQVSPGSRKGSSSGGISATTSEKIDSKLLALLEEEKAVRKKINDYKRKQLEENLDPLYIMENDPESEYYYRDSDLDPEFIDDNDNDIDDEDEAFGDYADFESAAARGDRDYFSDDMAHNYDSYHSQLSDEAGYDDFDDYDDYD